MSDRLVKKISPYPEPGEQPKPFSEYLKHPNLVLLGDPGAGKTHLFQHFTTAEEGYLLRARDFLNLDAGSLSGNKILFIDALDEKRAGRGDQNTVDAIVSKLCQLKPIQARIACRAADWLGETDLAAFQAYFDRAGDGFVLSLEPLSEQERLAVLCERGIAEPEAFLDEARWRGLEELLTNPQNLIMLSDVVQKKRGWPTSRTELFKETVDLLLSEHNTTHARRETGSYLSGELLEAAGGLCAVRLISDIAGISLAESSPNDDFPSYRCISICARAKAQAALGRRVFAAGPISETVDYTHRTIAEYLAASWLAETVRAGLPIGRALALIGVDGRPASELRGLHAWLTVFLPEYAATLIDADPFGVLSYGDAASLRPDLRTHLLEALANLAEIDPWFRRENWSSSAAAALSGLDIAESFRAILNNKDAGFSLRSLVLDSLSAGSPIPELQFDLLAILADTTAPYSERYASLTALLALGPSGVDSVLAVYTGLKSSADDLKLRAEILQEVYGNHLGAAEVASLLNQTLDLEDELVGSAFWGLDDAIADCDISDILDRLAFIRSRSAERCDAPNASSGSTGDALDQLEVVPSRSTIRNKFRNAMVVLRVVDKLLVRTLSLNQDLAGERLWKWLSFRWHCSECYDRTADELKAALSSNQGALVKLTDVAISSLAVEDLNWYSIFHLQELTLFSLENRLLLNRIYLALDHEKNDKRAFLYQVAIALTFRIGAEARSAFEDLYQYADGEEILEAVRADCCFCRIEKWREEESRRQQEYLAKRESRKAKTRSDFENSREQIRNGAHLRWLAWIGRVYFSLFSDVDAHAEPHKRLITELGKENTQAALEGLVALVRRGHITDLEDVVHMAAESKYYEWWYAVIAGLDEYTSLGHNLDALPDSYLQSALMIDCLHPTHWCEGNTRHRIDHQWKLELLRRRPQLIVNAYCTLARAALARKAQYVNGLHELMHLDSLEPFRVQVAMAFLEEFPTTSSQSLQELLLIALNGSDPDKLLELIRCGLAKCRTESIEDSYSLWLAAGFLLAPSEFKQDFETLETGGVLRMIWALRDVSQFRRGGSGMSDGTPLSVEQLEYIARLAASQFKKTQYPSTGWSGDTNPWDATEFTLKMINLLSADPSPRAAEALTRLKDDASMESYRDDVKHALAQQMVRQIDAQFQQPTWKETVEALMNGVPASVTDLHALVLAHLVDLGPHIAATNTDIYKRFWNEDDRGRITTPKSEESCRDALVDLLRPRISPHGVIVDPEGHMASDKRADIVAVLPKMKVVVELKRDYHAKVWTAIQNQLDRFYTRDPDAQGFGIYGIFWYGVKRGGSIPKPPAPLTMPRSAKEMEQQLQSLIPAEKRIKLRAVVIDVSGSEL